MAHPLHHNWLTERRLSHSVPETDGIREEEAVAKEDRGFASMDRSKQREIASKGGKAAHQKGTAHEWTSEEARAAGRKGGIASHQRRRERISNPTSNELRGLGAASRLPGTQDVSTRQPAEPGTSSPPGENHDQD